jgi:2-methylcitrate dehydratase PrpD
MPPHPGGRRKAALMHLVERFADWAVSFREKPLGDAVLHHARRAVIDWHAALHPGMVVPPVTLMQKAFAGESPNPRLKALIEGTAAHTVEVDDIFRDGIYHPGAPTIAAARALSEELRPIIVGYEISTRIGAAMGKAHYKHWHNTGTIGAFGAAAAAAEALRLDRKQFAHALATVATFASGLQQAFRMDSMSKPLHAGNAAQAGVTAALAAKEGVTGSLDVMTGFAAAMGDKAAFDSQMERLLATLGKEFHITRMTFKNHACCGHTFAAIDGALELKKRMQVQAKDIEEIEVATYKAGVEVAGYENPVTPAEGRFSLKYVVATALTHGSVRLAAFEPDRLADPATRSLLRKIKTTVDPELEAAFPGKRQARVAIRARGKREEWLQPTRIGDPEAPLSDRMLEEKYFELVTPVLGEAKAREVLARLWQLG